MIDRVELGRSAGCCLLVLFCSLMGREKLEWVGISWLGDGRGWGVRVLDMVCFWRGVLELGKARLLI